MKNLLLFLLLIIFTTSCGKDEEATFIDNLEGEYIGALKELDCNLPQSELSNIGCTTTITKKSDTEVSFSIDNASGNILTFSGIVNADSIITIPEFSNNQDMLEGAAFNFTKLRISLGAGCVIFQTDAAQLIFDEN